MRGNLAGTVGVAAGDDSSGVGAGIGGGVMDPGTGVGVLTGSRPANTVCCSTAEFSSFPTFRESRQRHGARPRWGKIVVSARE